MRTRLGRGVRLLFYTNSVCCGQSEASPRGMYIFEHHSNIQHSGAYCLIASMRHTCVSHSICSSSRTTTMRSSRVFVRFACDASRVELTTLAFRAFIVLLWFSKAGSRGLVIVSRRSRIPLYSPHRRARRSADVISASPVWNPSTHIARGASAPAQRLHQACELREALANHGFDYFGPCPMTCGAGEGCISDMRQCASMCVVSPLGVLMTSRTAMLGLTHIA
jgi:hypothetical protein